VRRAQPRAQNDPVLPLDSGWHHRPLAGGGVLADEDRGLPRLAADRDPARLAAQEDPHAIHHGRHRQPRQRRPGGALCLATGNEGRDAHDRVDLGPAGRGVEDLRAAGRAAPEGEPALVDLGVAGGEGEGRLEVLRLAPDVEQQPRLPLALAEAAALELERRDAILGEGTAAFGVAPHRPQAGGRVEHRHARMRSLARRQMQPAGASLPAGLEADLGDPLSHGADYIRRARGLGAQ
jgi:hypothetical protein